MGWKKSAIKSIARFSAPGWRAGFLARFIELGAIIARPRREVALSNIEIAYPGCSRDFRERTLRGVYRHLAWTAAETLALQKDPSQSLEWVVSTEGEDLLARAAKEGKGAVILTGHLGNWELLAAWLCQKGYPLTAIVRDPDDTDYRDTISEFRARVGLKTLPKQANMKAAIDLLRRGGFLGILSDQLAGRSEGIKVPFMGKPVFTFAGAAALGILAGSPILPVFSYREAPFRHRVVVRPPMPFPEEGDRKARILELTCRCNEAIESAVRVEPGQWLWLHRRWGRKSKER